LLTGPAFAPPWGVVTVFGALGLILGSVLFALLAALIDLYDEE
jgi:predicted PurR-regulated permease PerM